MAGNGGGCNDDVAQQHTVVNSQSVTTEMHATHLECSVSTHKVMMHKSQVNRLAQDSEVSMS